MTGHAIPFLVYRKKTKIADGLYWPDGVCSVLDIGSKELQQLPSVHAVRPHLETVGICGSIRVEFCTQAIGTKPLKAPTADLSFTITEGDVAFRAATSGRIFDKNAERPIPQI